MRVPDSVLARSTDLTPRIGWWLMTILAVGVAGYALALQDARPNAGKVFGRVWIDYAHFALGGVALLVGPLAFRRDILRARPALHSGVGMVYMSAMFVSGIAGLAMACVADGGLIAQTGFGALAVLWLTTSGLGLVAIKRGDVLVHRRWMVRSYALCYAAVTLRLQLPFRPESIEFLDAYRVIAWSCWVPNLLFAELWLRVTTAAGALRARAA